MHSLIADSVLVLAPHADDEVLGAGGLLARAGAEGARCVVAPFRFESSTRRNEMHAASSVLGYCLDSSAVADGWLSAVPLDRMTATIERLVAAHEPELVILPSPAEAHQEHQIVHDSAMRALRPSGGSGRYRPPRIVTFEHLADAWRLRHPVVPSSWYVALTRDHVDIQLRAMQAHDSQMRPVPSERSLESIEALARVRGAEAGVEYAEVFGVLRWLT